MKKIILILGIGILGMTLCAVPSIKRKDGTMQRMEKSITKSPPAAWMTR